MTQTPSTAIENVEQLKKYLQVAIQLEHATIPPYLTAAYSAKIEANKQSIEIIKAVVKEEMLHMTLAANLLNAIDGEPDLISPGFVPTYPTFLPTGQNDFEVGIEKFSEHTLQTFLNIERPTALKPEHAEVIHYITKTVPISAQHIDPLMLKDDNPLVPIIKAGEHYELQYKIAVLPHHHLSDQRKGISAAGRSLLPHIRHESPEAGLIELHYWSIGEFYKAIHLGFVELTNKKGSEAIFTGDTKKQIKNNHGPADGKVVDKYYSAGGDLMAVTDLKSALMAIDFIAGQGEGSNRRIYNTDGEIAHYYRFDQIDKKQYYRNPKAGGTGDEAGNPQGEKLAVDLDAVFPIKANAKIADYQGYPGLKEQALLFNGQYKRFLEKLHTAFNGQAELLDEVFFNEMFRIKYAIEKLIANEISSSGENAAPTFEMDCFQYPPEEVASAPASSASVTTSDPDFDPFETFVGLSVQLCGISSFDLKGTGYARHYFEIVEGIVGRELLTRLLQAFPDLSAAHFNRALKAGILNHPEFGPVASNITMLWYTATWFQLPDTWRDNYGARPEDRTFVPYPYAYAESLLGPSVGAHPAGAKPTGHQSWTLPPVCLPIPVECE